MRRSFINFYSYLPHAQLACVREGKWNRSSFSHLLDCRCISVSAQITSMIQSTRVQHSLHFNAIFGAHWNAKERLLSRQLIFSQCPARDKSIGFFSFLQSIRKSFVDHAIEQRVHFLNSLDESFQHFDWRNLKWDENILLRWVLIRSSKINQTNLFRSYFHRQNRRRLQKEKIFDWRHRLAFLAVENILEQKPHEEDEKSLK